MKLPLIAASIYLTTISGCKPRGLALAEVQNSGGACRSVSSGGTISQDALISNSKNPDCKTTFLPLPLVRQTKGFTCGAASLQSILFYWGDFFSEGVLQRILQSHKDNGTSYKRIAKFVLELNSAQSREKFDTVSGFDDLVEWNELKAVLYDREVLELLRRKASTRANFKNVVAGIAKLKESDVDIDRLSSGTSLRLTEGPSAQPNDNPNNARRSVRTAVAPQRDLDMKYATKLSVTQVPYRGNGTLPAGCAAYDSATTFGDASQFSNTGMTLEQLEQTLKGSSETPASPVLALTQAWTYDSEANYDVSTYAKGWDSGHYVVVVGIDPQNVYLMDPYNMGHYAFVPRDEFEKRWHDYDGFLNEEYERCPGGFELHHFGLAIWRNTDRTHVPDQVTKMY